MQQKGAEPCRFTSASLALNPICLAFSTSVLLGSFAGFNCFIILLGILSSSEIKGQDNSEAISVYFTDVPCPGLFSDFTVPGFQSWRRLPTTKEGKAAASLCWGPAFPPSLH